MATGSFIFRYRRGEQKKDKYKAAFGMNTAIYRTGIVKVGDKVQATSCMMKDRISNDGNSNGAITDHVVN